LPSVDVIRTERLELRRWRDDDLGDLAEMNADPEVVRYLRDGSPMTPDESAEQLVGFMRHWEDHGYGLWAAVLPETGEVIGFVGLAEPTFLPEVLPAVEVGWRLKRRHWGKGYATEGGREALRFGFDDLRLDRIVSIRHRDNDASRRVMKRLGMPLERETVHPILGVPLAVHALSEDAWRSARRPAPPS
jgi:RimJ/RimL family protein N-acetyltransferase